MGDLSGIDPYEIRVQINNAVPAEVDRPAVAADREIQHEVERIFGGYRLRRVPVEWEIVAGIDSFFGSDQGTVSVEAGVPVQTVPESTHIEECEGIGRFVLSLIDEHYDEKRCGYGGLPQQQRHPYV